MNIVIIIVRAAFFAATLQLFGLSIFGCVVAPGFRGRHGAWLGAAALAVLAAWLPAETIMMSGASLSLATLGTVLRETQFGLLWLGRAALLIAILALAPGRGRGAAGAIAACAGTVLVLTAAAGHAGASGSPFQLGADAVHLLAAGAWLGGLVPFAGAMRRPDAAAIARCFSDLGTVCVCLVLLTGGANFWFMVGNGAALTGTSYGRLLLLKLVLVAVLVMVAAANRFVLAPRAAVAALRRNALIETALGAAIVAIVAVLGTMVPGYYEAGG